MDGTLVIIEAFIIGCALGPILFSFAFDVSKSTIFTCMGIIVATLFLFNTSWTVILLMIFLIEVCLTLQRIGRTVMCDKKPSK